MGTTLGSHESVKRGEKRPYCRFAAPKRRDLDPSSLYQTVSLGSRVNKAERNGYRALRTPEEGRNKMLIEAKLEELGLALPEPPKIPPRVQVSFAWVRVHEGRAYV